MPPWRAATHSGFVAGIAVVGLGHRHPAPLEAAQAQLERLWHVSNLYSTLPMEELATKLSERFGGAHAFFSYGQELDEVQGLGYTARRQLPQSFQKLRFESGHHEPLAAGWCAFQATLYHDIEKIGVCPRLPLYAGKRGMIDDGLSGRIVPRVPLRAWAAHIVEFRPIGVGECLEGTEEVGEFVNEPAVEATGRRLGLNLF